MHSIARFYKKLQQKLLSKYGHTFSRVGSTKHNWTDQQRTGLWHSEMTYIFRVFFKIKDKHRCSFGLFSFFGFLASCLKKEENTNDCSRYVVFTATKNCKSVSLLTIFLQKENTKASCLITFNVKLNGSRLQFIIVFECLEKNVYVQRTCLFDR